MSNKANTVKFIKARRIKWLTHIMRMEGKRMMKSIINLKSQEKNCDGKVGKVGWMINWI